MVERGLHTAVLLHHARQLLQLVDTEKLGQRHFPSGNMFTLKKFMIKTFMQLFNGFEITVKFYMFFDFL